MTTWNNLPGFPIGSSNIPARTLLGNPTNAVGPIVEITASNTLGLVPTIQADGTIAWQLGGGGGSGDITAVSTINGLDGGALTGAAVVGLAAHAVNAVALVNSIATQRVVGRDSAGTGVAEHVSATQLLNWIGSTRGSLLYNGASGWAILTPGTSGHALVSQGAGADPTYASRVAPGADGASGRAAFWTSATAINGTSNWQYSDSGDVTQTLGDLANGKATALHLKSGTDQDLKILMEENGHPLKPWYFAVDASDAHRLVLGHNSSTPGLGTVSFKIQSSTGDMEWHADNNYSKAGTQNFTKEGTGSMQFRSAGAGQEISFRPKLLEALTLVDDGGGAGAVPIVKILPGGSTHKVNFYGVGTGTARQTITGSRGGNAALTSLLNAVNAIGIFLDNTTA